MKEEAKKGLKVRKMKRLCGKITYAQFVEESFTLLSN